MELTETPHKEPLLGKTVEELRRVAANVGLPPFAAGQMAQWLYRHHTRAIDGMSNISKRGRAALAEAYDVGCSPPEERLCSADGTVKYLYGTQAGGHVEAVYIPDGDRATLCVSSQVGCRMGCSFCMTGRQGFGGNLTATDILNQIYSLPERESLTNIVFMGQGEPLDNVDNVLRATRLLTAGYGYAWSPKRITISTVGLRKGLLRLLEESDCHVAVSLHSPFPAEREAMVSAERAFSLTEFLPMLARFDWTHQRRLSFEYIMFRGLNDTPAHARELVRLLAPVECRVNLIRFHTIPGTPYQPSEEGTMLRMRDYLTRHRIITTIRASRGQDILAACGMLSTAKRSQAL